MRALVLELVEGETLAARLSRGPLPVADALELAKQIAAALEAAHEQGIIHRDLKPANISLTKAGVVKVLDFGLAKLTETPGAMGSSPGPIATDDRARQVQLCVRSRFSCRPMASAWRRPRPLAAVMTCGCTTLFTV